MTDEPTETGLIKRVRRGVEAASRRLEASPGRVVERLRGTLEEKIAPLLEQKARDLLLELTEPENARRLQSGLANMAQFAMERGFRADPNARLLFEFVDGLEERHSREAVLEVVVEHAFTYEQELLTMLLASARAEAPAEVFGQFRDRASGSLLRLLCSLAALERDETPPEGVDAQIRYFEEAPIEERFKPLASMAAGRAEAFEEAESRDASGGSDVPARDDDRPFVRRLIDRLPGPSSDALTRHVPTLAEPATRFLTTSYLFFLQSYIVRAMVEELPSMLQMIGELEREAQVEEDDDVVDIN